MWAHGYQTLKGMKSSADRFNERIGLQLWRVERHGRLTAMTE